MSDSVRPHRWQPTRLPHPWDSQGKNTEVGCHFLLQCMKGKSESEVAQSCPTLSDPMDSSLPGSSPSMGFSRQELLTPCRKSYNLPRQHIKKQRHYFANKGPSSQSYGFSSSHVWMPHSSTLAWKIPWTEEPGAAVHGVAKSRTRLSNFTFTFSLSCIEEGNGNPLQCSCLENPRDEGAWWAAIYGVTQSRT